MEREWGEIAVSPSPDLDEVVAALSALGYQPSEAREALSGISIDPGAPLEDKVMTVLQRMGAA